MNIPASIRQHPRSVAIVVACVAAVGGGVATPYVLYGNTTTTPTSKSQTDTEVPVVAGTLQKGTPDYKTILPAGHSIQDYGGWTRVSPPKRDPVYAYVDHIGTVPVNVSQQPIPKDFGDDPDSQVHDLAEGYGASNVIKAGSTTVYIGTSAKGPQSVIFIKDGLLVLIKASAAVPDQRWQEYIQSLG